MKQVLNSLRFFAVIAIFASIILLVFLMEKRLVQNFKKYPGNNIGKYPVTKNISESKRFR
jgi:hypothetical protein